MVWFSWQCKTWIWGKFRTKKGIIVLWDKENNTIYKSFAGPFSLWMSILQENLNLQNEQVWYFLNFLNLNRNLKFFPFFIWYYICHDTWHKLIVVLVQIFKDLLEFWPNLTYNYFLLCITLIKTFKIDFKHFKMLTMNVRYICFCFVLQLISSGHVSPMRGTFVHLEMYQ